ncbi:MAG: hypothetical protein ACTS6A_02400 [Candidatus Hodgkinia cicadicola]
MVRREDMKQWSERGIEHERGAASTTAEMEAGRIDLRRGGCLLWMEVGWFGGWTRKRINA